MLSTVGSEEERDTGRQGEVGQNVAWAEVYLRPFDHNTYGPKIGGCAPFLGIVSISPPSVQRVASAGRKTSKSAYE